ncbi:hypothetical protein KA013_05545 [Patescibacteria group bacterium]|nr:hypothetical protein [Patescibacteria group bacterium]
MIIYEVDSSLEQTRHIDAKFTSFSEQKRTEIEQVVTIVTGSKDHTDQLLKRLRTFFQMELQMRE